MFCLEKLCIDLIVQKFQRFYFAFTTPNDENLQRNFEFLQRRYSDALLRELSEAKKLKVDHFELLINEYVSFFNSKWLTDTSSKKPVEHIFRRLPNITKIKIRDCGDEILVNIAKFCPKIVQIDAKHSYVTDSGVKYLYEIKTGVLPCPELKVLKINYTSVTLKSVERLIRNITSLEKFDHPYVPLTLHFIRVRKSEKVRFYNLVELNLRKLDGFLEFHVSKFYTYVLKTCLTVCPKLESFACYILDEEDLNLFTNCHLRKLHLDFSMNDSKINIDDFLKMNVWELTSLKLNGCAMSISALAEQCPNLKEFFTKRVNFTDDDDDADSEPNFEFLTSCSFTDTESSSNKGICLLLSLSPKLESIYLESCMLSLEMKRQILLWCENSCAKKIDLDEISIILEMEFIRDILLNCPSLEEMCLGNFDFIELDSDYEMARASRKLKNLANSLSNKPKIYFI